MTEPLLGIDLGTTFTVVAHLGNEGADVLAGPDGTPLIPSAVAFDPSGQLLVGAAAAARLDRDPAAGVRAFKRDMGTARRFRLGTHDLGPTELSALVLREALAVAEQALGQPARRAVVTVPAYFQEPQRAATVEAARLAGVDLVRLVNEPTAAAVAYGALDALRSRKIAVLDLGGGTFDVTLLEVFEGVIEVVGTAGNARLGGEDFTDRLLARVMAETGLGPSAPAPLLSALRAECEAAKRLLSAVEGVRMPLPTVADAPWSPGATHLLRRRDFEVATASLVDEMFALVGDALARANWRAPEVDEVLLAGGATRGHALRERVRARFGRAPVDGPDPDLAIALGAALEAGLAAGHPRAAEIVVTDVLAHSLGVSVVREGEDRLLDGYFMPVLHRNTTLPTRRLERVYTVHPAQTTIKVRVYQGDNRMVADNTLLGTFSVNDIPGSKERGAPTQAVDLSFAHDLNGLLDVEATVVATGKKAGLLIEQHAGRLDPARRDAALAALAALKVHPRELLPNRLLLEAATSLHARLDPRRRALLDGPLFAFEDALAREDNDAASQAAIHLRAALSHPALRPEEA